MPAGQCSIPEYFCCQVTPVDYKAVNEGNSNLNEAHMSAGLRRVHVHTHACAFVHSRSVCSDCDTYGVNIKPRLQWDALQKDHFWLCTASQGAHLFALPLVLQQQTWLPLHASACSK